MKNLPGVYCKQAYVHPNTERKGQRIIHAPLSPRLALSTPNQLQTRFSHPNIWAGARTCAQPLHQAIRGTGPDDGDEGQTGSADAIMGPALATISIGSQRGGEGRWGAGEIS